MNEEDGRGRLGLAARLDGGRWRPRAGRGVGLGLGAGLALLVGYLLVVVATLGGHGAHVRPLYEGFSPSSPYHWVNPPPVFAPGNMKPHAVSQSVKLGPNGSTVAAVSTPEAQVVLGLGNGAIGPHGNDTEALVNIAPLDPATLAKLPSNLRADGNVYRIRITYRPSGTPVATLAKAGSMTLIVPETATNLFQSDDGKSWNPIEFRKVPPTDLTLGVTLEKTGYYVAGTNVPLPAGSPTASTSNTVAIAVAAAGAAAVVLLATFVIVRWQRRRRRAAIKSARDARRRNGRSGRRTRR